MSKLSIDKKFVFVEHCNWSFYTPFLRTEIPFTVLTKYNVINVKNNVVNGTNNVIHIGV